jgi:hypothetical protein
VTEDEEVKVHNQGRVQPRTLTRQKSGEGKAEFSELGEIFKQYCDKFRPLDKNSKVHVGLQILLKPYSSGKLRILLRSGGSHSIRLILSINQQFCPLRAPRVQTS